MIYKDSPLEVGLLGHTIYKLKRIGPPITVHLMSNATSVRQVPNTWTITF